MVNPFDITENKNISLVIDDALFLANNKIGRYKKIACSISGGADSDIMLDICTKFDTEKKIKYVFFDTGIEYEATKKHLDYRD